MYEAKKVSKNLVGASVLLFLGVFMVFIAGCSSCSVMPAGTVGVITLYGHVTGDTIYDGLHFINPVSSVTKMSTKTQTIDETVTSPSSEGMSVTLEVVMLCHLNGQAAPELFRTVGEDYMDKVVKPVYFGAIRETTASHQAHELSSASRESIAGQMNAEVTSQLAARGIAVEKVIFKNVTLPELVKNAVEKKQQAQQEAQAMSYRLQKEQQEADRKRIEAQGIKDFQTIVSQGISEPLLKWKGIEATEQLAHSNNAKIVIIGSGKDGLPIILGGDQK